MQDGSTAVERATVRLAGKGAGGGGEVGAAAGGGAGTEIGIGIEIGIAGGAGTVAKDTVAEAEAVEACVRLIVSCVCVIGQL